MHYWLYVREILDRTEVSNNSKYYSGKIDLVLFNELNLHTALFVWPLRPENQEVMDKF